MQQIFAIQPLLKQFTLFQEPMVASLLYYYSDWEYLSESDLP